MSCRFWFEKIFFSFRFEMMSLLIYCKLRSTSNYVTKLRKNMMLILMFRYVEEKTKFYLYLNFLYWNLKIFDLEINLNLNFQFPNYSSTRLCDSAVFNLFLKLISYFLENIVQLYSVNIRTLFERIPSNVILNFT